MSIKVTYINLIPEKLEEIKNEKGITKVEVSEKAGMSKQNLDKISKAQNPHIQSIIKIAYGIGCDITDLFRYEVTKE